MKGVDIQRRFFIERIEDGETFEGFDWIEVSKLVGFYSAEFPA